MRHILLAVALCLAGPAQAQFYAQPITPRPLPPGVSFPTIASTDVVYPGCPTPPTSFGNIWEFDAVNGFTMTQYTNGTGGAPLVTAIGGASGQGTVTHPWKDFLALWGAPISGTASPTPGYSTMLLSTAFHSGFSTGPILAGDKVILMSGNYGKIKGGDGLVPGNNVPALTVVAGSGQTPVLSYLNLVNSSGFVFDGTNGDFKIQSLNDDSAALVSVSAANGNTVSNFFFNHVDISSASVLTANGWNAAAYIANARRGVVLNALSCVAVTNSHVYVTNEPNAGAIQVFAPNALVQNNEIDHIATDAIQYSGSNTALINNYGHDFVNAEPGDQYYGIQNLGSAPFAAGIPQTNVFMAKNQMIESLDAGQTTAHALMNGYLSSCGDITNYVGINNLFAGTANNGFAPGAIHNALIANNSVMFQGIDVSIAHCGSTGPEGFFPSNVRVTNNLAAGFTVYGNAVLVDHNISTSSSGTVYLYNSFGIGTTTGLVFQNPTPGSVVALPAVGPNNLMDGNGPANEYTVVPTSFSPAMSPAPNFTPLTLSPAKTSGGSSLVPPITDFNGATFAPPYSIGALN